MIIHHSLVSPLPPPAAAKKDGKELPRLDASEDLWSKRKDVFLRCVIGQKTWSDAFQMPASKPVNFCAAVSTSNLAFLFHILELNLEDWLEEDKRRATPNSSFKRRRISNRAREASYRKWALSAMEFRRNQCGKSSSREDALSKEYA